MLKCCLGCSYIFAIINLMCSKMHYCFSYSNIWLEQVHTITFDSPSTQHIYFNDFFFNELQKKQFSLRLLLHLQSCCMFKASDISPMLRKVWALSQWRVLPKEAPEALKGRLFPSLLLSSSPSHCGISLDVFTLPGTHDCQHRPAQGRRIPELSVLGSKVFHH